MSKKKTYIELAIEMMPKTLPLTTICISRFIKKTWGINVSKSSINSNILVRDARIQRRVHIQERIEEKRQQRRKNIIGTIG